MMDYGSMFPDAVPLQKVDAFKVATHRVDIFTRYGLPEEILLDQGSVFVKSLIKDLCNILDIRQLCTSSYHSKNDGKSEQWHGILKETLMKAETAETSWNLLHCLFTY